ncbi:RpoE-regulated lipoprotein [Providencia sp.]|uniref:RpoE-regulated lipoprotein n=1 Tax=Providencia sp. TaxID=589 RepID=UPI003F947F6E
MSQSTMSQNTMENVSIMAKMLKVTLLVGTVLLSGCAGTSAFSPSTWFTSPLTWFSSPLVVSDSGVGQVTSMTPMKMDIVKEQLDDRYTMRSGMQMENGDVVTIFQGIDDEKIKIEVIGPENGYVSRIIISDPDVVTEWDTKVGTSFSDIYDKAFGVCVLGARMNDIPTVECTAKQSKKVVYRFSGKWHGPENLMPSDSDLKDWQVSQIIWTK